MGIYFFLGSLKVLSNKRRARHKAARILIDVRQAVSHHVRVMFLRPRFNVAKHGKCTTIITMLHTMVMAVADVVPAMCHVADPKLIPIITKEMSKMYG